jgi:hypothetical protein
MEMRFDSNMPFVFCDIVGSCCKSAGMASSAIGDI